jgi:pilus assembly protein Flp/PilA
MGVQAADYHQRRSFAARLGEFRKDENGATAIEYGLIVALIFIAIVAAINSYSSSTSQMYNTITTTLNEAG